MEDFVLRGTLAPRHKEAGLTLVETDDHILELRDSNGRIKHLSSTGATMPEIFREADEWLREKQLNG